MPRSHAYFVFAALTAMAATTASSHDQGDPLPTRFQWGVGGELAVAQILFVRAGAADLDGEDDYPPNDDVSGWGFGLGIPAGSFRSRFDYTKTSAFYEDTKYGFAIDWLL